MSELVFAEIKKVYQIEWYYKPIQKYKGRLTHLEHGGKILNVHETITHFKDYVVLYSLHSEPEEVPVDYIMQKSKIVLLEKFGQTKTLTSA